MLAAALAPSGGREPPTLAVAKKTKAGEAEEHHRPSGGLGSRMGETSTDPLSFMV